MFRFLVIFLSFSTANFCGDGENPKTSEMNRSVQVPDVVKRFQIEILTSCIMIQIACVSLQENVN